MVPRIIAAFQEEDLETLAFADKRPSFQGCRVLDRVEDKPRTSPMYTSSNRFLNFVSHKLRLDESECELYLFLSARDGLWIG